MDCQHTMSPMQNCMPGVLADSPTSHRSSPSQFLLSMCLLLLLLLSLPSLIIPQCCHLHLCRFLLPHCSFPAFPHHRLLPCCCHPICPSHCCFPCRDRRCSASHACLCLCHACCHHSHRLTCPFCCCCRHHYSHSL